MSLIEPGREHALELIADHCLAVRSVIAERGTPAMARLIDLLLFEVGRALAEEAAADIVDGHPAGASNGS